MGTRKWLSLVFPVLICMPGLSTAQEKDDFLQNQIKFNPLKLVDLVNPGIELGFERFHTKRTSSQLMVTWQKEILNTTPWHNYHGWRFAFEQKYFTRHQGNRGYYMGFELAYLNVDYDNVGEFETDTTQSAIKYEDSFHTAKQSYSANFKAGIQFSFKSFVVDIYSGIGIKYKMVGREGLQDPNDVESHPIDPNVYYISNKEGNYFGINVPLSIRICYRF